VAAAHGAHVGKVEEEFPRIQGFKVHPDDVSSCNACVDIVVFEGEGFGTLKSRYMATPL
jgi:predicted Holliday junction resolvase-like endonuclease